MLDKQLQFVIKCLSLWKKNNIFLRINWKASDQIMPKASGYVSAPGRRSGETSIVTLLAQPFIFQRCSLKPQVWSDPKFFCLWKAIAGTVVRTNGAGQSFIRADTNTGGGPYKAEWKPPLEGVEVIHGSWPWRSLIVCLPVYSLNPVHTSRAHNRFRQWLHRAYWFRTDPPVPRIRVWMSHQKWLLSSVQ